MENGVRFENMKRLDERHAAIKPPPRPRVPHPVDIESVPPHAIDSGERRIELLAMNMLHARPVALHEAVASRCPCAVNVDHIIPFGRFDLRQEARLQDIAEEGLAGRDDRPRMLANRSSAARDCRTPRPPRSTTTFFANFVNRSARP